MTAAVEGGEWSAACPGRTLPPGETRYPLYRRLGGPRGRSVWAEKSRPDRDSIPDRPALSQLLYRLSYPAHKCTSSYVWLRTNSENLNSVDTRKIRSVFYNALVLLYQISVHI